MKGQGVEELEDTGEGEIGREVKPMKTSNTSGKSWISRVLS
jgi:hypothetical protein